MQENQPHLTTQLPLLERLRSNCDQYHQILQQLEGQLEQLSDAGADAIEQVSSGHRAAQRSVSEQIEQQYSTRCRQIDETADTGRATARADCQHRLLERQAAFESFQTSHLKSLEGELWVLQSVCDEKGEDTPVTQYQRAKSLYLNQQKVSEDTVTSLQERMADVDAYLVKCHTTTDEILPTATLQPADAETNRQRIAAEAGASRVAADQIFRLRLPAFILGLRPVVIACVLTIGIALPVTIARADLRAFVNPDLAAPDWAWLGVSLLAGAGSSAVVMSILFLMTQHSLRALHQQMQQSAANAQYAMTSWKTQSERELLKLRKIARKWQNQVNELRERKTQTLQGGTDRQLQQQRQQLAHETNAIEQICRQTIEAIDQQQQADHAALSDWKSSESRRLEVQMESDLQAAMSKLKQDLQQQETVLLQHRDQLLRRWKHESTMAQSLAASSLEVVREHRDWPELREGNWNPPEQMPVALPAGQMEFLIRMPPPAEASANVTDQLVQLPAVLRFPADTSLVIDHDAAGREAALDFVRAILLKLLTSIAPGRLQFTLIDPVGLGQSFSAMMHMADFDELLIGSRIWTESSQIRDRLQKVTEHMENVFQTYLRSEFDTIEQYNQSAGEVAEPYHYVVVAGFPTNLSEEAARHLASIITSGARCGVHAIITRDTSQSAPRSFDVNILKNECLGFQVRKGQVVPITDEPVDIRFRPLQPPAAAEYVAMVRAVGEKSRNARRVEVSFTRISPRPEELWTQSTADGIDLPIGRAGAARLQYLRLGRGTSQHVMIAGKTGSGKSTLLHILITNLSLHYSPAEIQFYLIDFKKGVEFRTYAANQLPHARVIAIESDREFGLSVLERLDEVLQERGELFRSRGVQDVPAFREQFPDERLPRILLLIDEFQEFFVAEDRVSSRASLLLDRLIRQGRAFGVHVILGSQTLGGAYSLARSTLGQVAVRIALQCSEGDAHLILSEENSAARLLTRPGEAIYNDANGMSEGNHPFQIAWLNERRREQAIHDMLTYQRRGGLRRLSETDSRIIVFEGNVPPSAEQCGPLNARLASDIDATRRVSEYLPIWVGEPVAIAPPTCLELRRASGQNLLIVGQDADMADSILLMAALSCFHPGPGEFPAGADESAVHTASQTRFLLLHDGRDRNAIGRFSAMLSATQSPVYATRDLGEADQTLGQLHAQLLLRESTATEGEHPELVCAIRNLGQFRTLRRDEDDYGMGGFGERREATPATQLTDLIKRGPLVGIHLLIWSDTYSNATRWLANSLMREFEYRIAFRMNPTDSASLLDSPVAAALSPGRAMLYRDQTGAADKFRPFAWPGIDWLRNVIPKRHPDTDLQTELDIDSIRIE